MKKAFLPLLLGVLFCNASAAKPDFDPAAYVNPFIGTTNFGTTNPGAVCPYGLMSVTPFNVMGSADNVYDKDARWFSTPYEYQNPYLTGFSHVNLSGVGCPELASLLLMPTTGELNVDYRQYGTAFTDQQAEPGYYANHLTRYGIDAEVSATMRTSIARFTYPGGQGNILFHLGEGLTNESGATVRRVSATEYEGSKLLGGFCYYNRQGVFPVYFVIRVDKVPRQSGYWKLQRPMTGVEAEWDPDNGKYKIYSKYTKEMSGDDIGVYFTFDTKPGEQVQVQIGVSFVSIANARENLEREQNGFDFDGVRTQARKSWNDLLSRIEVEGGTEEQKTIFYTALYHMMIHPNILQDVNGEYPMMESSEIGHTDHTRYTVFSLWDTYRNLHPFMCLVFPDKQLDMVRTLVDMYNEWGWMPRWELYGNETLTMSGDPATVMVADTWLRGLRDFDVQTAYQAMLKSALTPGKDNFLRPDNDDYMALGYVPLREQFDNSVSHALEYYIADFALSRLAAALGNKDDAALFARRALGYKKYFCKETKTLRPVLPDGSFYGPFDPLQGSDFEPNPGFHEGTAWNYTFYIPHDIKGLMRLMGGEKAFVKNLENVFEANLYDPSNEPDITYPYLFSYIDKEAWRTDYHVSRLLAKCFGNRPDGLPGNDDTGTMSAWAVYSMMGFYPDCPGIPRYMLTAPVFDRVTIQLDPEYYPAEKLVIEAEKASEDAIYVDEITVNGKPLKGRFISHQDLSNAGTIRYRLKTR